MQRQMDLRIQTSADLLTRKMLVQAVRPVQAIPALIIDRLSRPDHLLLLLHNSTFEQVQTSNSLFSCGWLDKLVVSCQTCEHG